MNHSPAPWKLSESGNSIRDANGRIIAIVDCERKENGPLFAASPELLRSVNSLLSVLYRECKRRDESEDPTVYLDELPEVIEARLLIAQRAHDPNANPSADPSQTPTTKEEAE